MEQVVDSQRGTVNSVHNLAVQLGWAVGPFLSGLMQKSFGFSPLFISTCLLYALSAGLTWLFFHKTRTEAHVYVSEDERWPAD